MPYITAKRSVKRDQAFLLSLASGVFSSKNL